MEKLVILGSGCAGLTAAIYAARANLEPLLVSGGLPGGQLTQTTEVENFPGFVDGIQGYELMEAFENQAKRFGTRFKSDVATAAALKPGGPHELVLASGETIQTRGLVIATGARPRTMGLASEEALRNKGVSYCATCDGAFFRGVPIAVVGGGDSAIEEALFLTHFGSKVIVIHRRDELRASRIMAQRAHENPKIEFCWDSVVDEVLGVEQDKLSGLRVRNVKTDAVSTIDCGALFVAIGHIPDTDIFAGQLDTDDAGFVLAEGNSSHTSVEGVFVAGDCSDHVYQQAVTAAGMGCKAAIDAERWLAAL